MLFSVFRSTYTASS